MDFSHNRFSTKLSSLMAQGLPAHEARKTIAQDYEYGSWNELVFKDLEAKRLLGNYPWWSRFLPAKKPNEPFKVESLLLEGMDTSTHLLVGRTRKNLRVIAPASSASVIQVIGKGTAAQSAFLRSLVTQQIASGGGLLVLDPSIQTSLTDAVLTAAEICNRAEEAEVLNMQSTPVSRAFNFLAGITAPEMAESLIRLIGGISLHDSTLANALQLLCEMLIDAKWDTSPSNLLSTITNPQLFSKLGDDSFITSSAAYSNLLAMFSRTRFSGVFATEFDEAMLTAGFEQLQTALRQLLAGPIAKGFSACPTLDVAKLAENNGIYCISQFSPGGATAEAFVQGSVMRQLLTTAYRRIKEGASTLKPFTVVVRLQQSNSGYLPTLMHVAAEANMQVAMVTETINNLEFVKESLQKSPTSAIASFFVTRAAAHDEKMFLHQTITSTEKYSYTHQQKMEELIRELPPNQGLWVDASARQPQVIEYS